MKEILPIQLYWFRNPWCAKDWKLNLMLLLFYCKFVYIYQSWSTCGLSWARKSLAIWYLGWFCDKNNHFVIFNSNLEIIEVLECLKDHTEFEILRCGIGKNRCGIGIFPLRAFSDTTSDIIRDQNRNGNAFLTFCVPE